MRKSTNTAGYRAGCIHKISLKNFVTYKEVEFFPGKSLNLIIGPNGTGKSTFVCAIILGLCGKTSVIGRAKKISEYVKSGCEEATIIIELYTGNQNNVVIKRVFNIQDNSTWYINGARVRERDVQELISTYNIQVDNLCQLLPQDRVQDFSKMDPQQLLRSTLTAVGGQESVSQLEELIQSQQSLKGCSNKLESNTQFLQEQIRLNERLKLMIDAMHQRREMEEEIIVCERKKVWFEYQQHREKVVELEGDKKRSSEVVNKHKKRMEPLERELESARKKTNKFHQDKQNNSNKMHTSKEKVKELLTAIKNEDGNIKDLQESYEAIVKRHQNKEKELAASKAVYEKLKTDRSILMEKVGDEAKVKMDLAELQRPLIKMNAAMDTLKKKKMEIQYDLENNVLPQMRMYQNKMSHLQNVDEKRLEVLRQYNEDTYRAVLWYRDHKDMFKHAVYEPMMLEINFTDVKFARYLESTVPARDLIAFTFESSTDMNLFLKRVRIEGGMKRVNAVCSQGSGFNKPQNNIQQLSYLGFYTYLVDTITAPDAITRYLCKQYNIHRIPIGNDHTYQNSGKVPNNITFFFTENHRFSIKVSSYSGMKSSSTIEIRPAKLLANTVDMDQMDNISKQLARLEKTAQTHRAKTGQVDKEVESLDAKIREQSVKVKHFNEEVEKLRSIATRLRLQEKRMQEIREEFKLDLSRERESCDLSIKGCVSRQVELQRKLCTSLADYQKKLHNDEAIKVALELIRNATHEQELALSELTKDFSQAQATLEQIHRQLNIAKNKAKEKLLEAKKASNNMLPQDPGFPDKEKFEALPAELDELLEYCHELQTRMSCMEEEDRQVIKEYEDRQRVIAKLQNEVSSSTDKSKSLEAKMKALRSKWLPPLESLLEKINRSFGEMFAKLGCAGEIKLDKGASEDDYERYGIAILVRFRSSEQLQQLTRHAQSGGERSLSTAVYLMALQTLTTVPFRCVDEINQGMDATNERKMLQLLVKVTTECDNAQYFLLTPKLLSNLEYNPKITILTIMNGKKIIDHSAWDQRSFIENASRSSQGSARKRSKLAS